MKSSPDEGGDAVRAGDASGDEWSREATRARVVAGLKEMVVALVEVGDFEGAQRVSTCLLTMQDHELTNEFDRSGMSES